MNIFDTMTNSQADSLMNMVNGLSPITIKVIKIIAALSGKLKNNPELEPFIRPQLVLLSNMMNIKQNDILRQLRPRFEQMLVGYIIYMDQFITNTINLEHYQEKHEMLVYFNQLVKESVQHNCLNEFNGIF